MTVVSIFRSIFRRLRRKRAQPCGYKWIVRRRIRMAFSQAPAEWWSEDVACILAKGHAGQHQSERGNRL